MLFLTLLATLAVWGESKDWTEGMFPFNYTGYDTIHLPDVYGCKFILTPTNGLILYGTVDATCVGVPEYPDGGIVESRLSIVGTALEELPVGVFTTWGQITELRLEMNSKLRTIEPMVFFHLTSLTNLSISNNYNLEALHPETFDGLLNLKELRFVKNNLKTLFHFTLATRPFVLPSLVFLDISDNPIQRVTRDDFVEMDDAPLENLVMKLCDLDWIESDAFFGLKKLRYLNLGENNLATEVVMDLVTSLNTSSPLLMHLGISGNILSKNIYNLLDVIAFTSISSLDISKNHFDMFTSHFFPRMPKIETLYLREMSAFDVQKGTFSDYLLPKLKYIYFTGNRLPGFVSGLRLPKLIELDISENSCLDCIINHNTDFTSIFQINENDLQDLKSLEVINISKNNIYHITRFMFFGLESLKALYLSNCSIFAIDEYAFADLSRLEHLDLSRNRFSTPEKLLPAIFDGLISLTSLRLDFCSITILYSDIFIYVTNLKYLALMGNDILELDPNIFLPLASLVRLDLSNNIILPWKEQLFSRNNELETLSVASNHLYRYTPEMAIDLGHISFVNMRDNPLSCDCDLVRTLLDSNSELPSENYYGLNDTAVRCVSPKKWSDVEVLEFVKLNSINYNCMHWSLYLFIIGVCVLFTLLICSISIYYLRWYLRHWLFLLKQAWRSSFPAKKPPRKNSKYKYDAFVSYSNEDRNFVIRMVAMMETYEPFFRLCVFERDFNAGEVICESVVDCLEVSKKTILILTDAFARSQWCQWELQMAHHKRFFFKSESQDSLILIKLGDIMDAHMTPTLRYLMKTRIYLQWYPDPKRQRVFWQKLREALQSQGNRTEINV